MKGVVWFWIYQCENQHCKNCNISKKFCGKIWSQW